MTPTTAAAVRSRWAAIGAAVAVTLGAGGIGLVDATEPDGASAFVPIEPCRLADTRPNTIGPGGTMTFDGWGTTGDCTLPTDTTGLALNVTAVDATQQTNLRFHPTGTPTPETANLNPTPGAPPTPNAVNVTLNATTGEFDVYNRFGNVAVVIDAMGYYTDHTHDDRYYTEDESDQRFGFEWVLFNVSGSVRFASPGLADVTVNRPDTPDGYYCIELPDGHTLEPNGAVATISDHINGLQAWAIAVTTTVTDGVCSSTGQPWDLAVETIRLLDTGPVFQDAAFRLLIPPEAVEEPEF